MSITITAKTNITTTRDPYAAMERLRTESRRIFLADMAKLMAQGLTREQAKQRMQQLADLHTARARAAAQPKQTTASVADTLKANQQAKERTKTNKAKVKAKKRG